MTDQLHRDTVHRFNVIFNNPNRNTNELQSTHTFEIYPIYWTTIIIPGHGYIKGVSEFNTKGFSLLSGSGHILVNTSTSAVPKVAYSGSIIYYNTTMISGSGVLNQYADVS